jgi:replicative DNA helicase
MSETHPDDPKASRNFDMLERIARPQVTSLSDAMERVFQDIENRVPPVEWRVADEPWGTYAFRPHSLLVVGAPTSGGKTALLQSSLVMAMQRNPSLRVLVANNESQTNELIQRIIAFLTEVNLRHVRQRDRTHCTPELMAAARDQMAAFRSRLHFVERPFTVDQMALEAKEFGANIVCLDTLQKARLAEYDGDAQDTVRRIMERLRALADQGVCVATAASLSRSGVTHMKARAGSTDSNELDAGIFLHSSEIETHANDAYVLLPERGAKTTFRDDEPYVPIKMWLNHVKSRDDMKTHVPLLFDGRYQRFMLRVIDPKGSRPSSGQPRNQWQGKNPQRRGGTASSESGNQGTQRNGKEHGNEHSDHEWI